MYSPVTYYPPLGRVYPRDALRRPYPRRFIRRFIPISGPAPRPPVVDGWILSKFNMTESSQGYVGEIAGTAPKTFLPDDNYGSAASAPTTFHPGVKQSGFNAGS